VIHDIPLAQLFALLACNAWSKGLEPVGENYIDREITRLMRLSR
jgi:hypothetical protein